MISPALYKSGLNGKSKYNSPYFTINEIIAEVENNFKNSLRFDSSRGTGIDCNDFEVKNEGVHTFSSSNLLIRYTEYAIVALPTTVKKACNATIELMEGLL